MVKFDVPGVPGEVCWCLIGGRVRDFVEFRVPLSWPSLWLAWVLGLGLFRSGAVGWCIRAALGLVCLALFLPGLDGLDVWVWVGLGFAQDGEIAGVWRIFLLCCWSDDGSSVWDTRYIHTFKVL